MGSTFAGRYQVIEELGRGGMGKVYKVFDTEIDAKIALKIIKPEIAADKATIERFRNELKMARDISHKNICRMYDLGREAGLYYITMEYVQGEDLRNMIRMSGRLGIGTAVSVARQISEGLAEAHRRGIIHRDLKPSNIMIDREGNIRIMDFGIARVIKTKGITGAGLIIGTPEYMSPEQVEGKGVDARSDIYSLGIILFEMLTGRVPFDGDTPFTVGVKQKSEAPQDPRRLNPDIPEDLSRLTLKCLEKAEDRRYQSAEELRADLEKIAQGIPTTERLLPKIKASTSKQITVTLGLKKLLVPTLIVAGLAVVALFWVLAPKKIHVAAAPKPSIAVITFENLSGDASYDYLRKAIPNLLITSLEQSRDLSVITWERMHDLLKQMGRENVESIDSDLGFELCRKDGVGTIVLGSFVKAGEMFATDVKVLDVETKRLIKSASARGEGVRSILEKQIGDLSKEISSGVGLSSREIAAAEEVGIADRTTASMEAYSFYLKGRELYEKFFYDQARISLERAVELDPQFAAAHLSLAYVYSALNDSAKTEEAFKKADALADKATEKERLYIKAACAEAVDKDRDKKFRILKQITEKYPKEKEAYFELGQYYRSLSMRPEAIAVFRKALALDPQYGFALNQMAYTLAEMGDYAKAVEEFQRYAELFPADPNPLDSMAENYFRMGKLDEAIAAYKKVLDIRPDFFQSMAGISYIYALKEDYKESLNWMERFIAAAPSPGWKGTGAFLVRFYSFWTGSYSRALSDLDNMIRVAGEAGFTEGKAGAELLASWIQAERGDYPASRAYLKRWYDFVLSKTSPKIAGSKSVYHYFLGSLDLKEGRLPAAEASLKEMESLIPEVQPASKAQIEFLLGYFRGEILLARGETDKAITVLEKMAPQTKPPALQMILPLYTAPFLKDTLARAYEKKAWFGRAIAEYERLITFDPAHDDRSLINPRYHYRLARLYEQQGQTTKAAAQYRIFLDLWSGADPDLPDFADAKKRLAAIEKR